MDAAWPVSAGEAIHTSTFLGHPVGCAMALAQVAELRGRRLTERSARLGRSLQQWLRTDLGKFVAAGEAEVRGLGLMAGVALTDANGSPDTDRALAVMRRMLERGIIVLPEGDQAEVIALTPPLIISSAELKRAVKVLSQVLKEHPSHGRHRTKRS